MGKGKVVSLKNWKATRHRRQQIKLERQIKSAVLQPLSMEALMHRMQQNSDEIVALVEEHKAAESTHFRDETLEHMLLRSARLDDLSKDQDDCFAEWKRRHGLR